MDVPLVRLLLDGIKYDRLGSGSGSTGRTQFQSDATIKGVISSFVEVEEYKKKGNLDVRLFFILFCMIWYYLNQENRIRVPENRWYLDTPEAPS